MLGRIGQIRVLRESEGERERERERTCGRYRWSRLKTKVGKIMEACYGDGNVIKGDRTFGATNNPKIRIVAQSTIRIM